MAFIPVYILILAGTILVDYVAGLLIATSSGKKRTFWLVMSLIANIGCLCVFKYYNFFMDTFQDVSYFFGWPISIPPLKIILPIGLSFHTFQAMSYTIEVYRGHQEAEKNLGIYALYVMFYPQLVAGPIERPQNLLWQFRTHHRFDGERVAVGLRQMGWGFFKKVVVADRLGQIVDVIYANPHQFSGPTLALGTCFFSFQIYADFSGYSDIAIGAAKVMGFDLMKNFNHPYLSRSISEFWKRWHISLSTWFRDYFYIPLGGNRVSWLRWQGNLLLTFMVSGLWHGANWTFIIWGVLNGIYLVAENTAQFLWKKYGPSKTTSKTLLPGLQIPRNLLQWGTTFAFISLSWLFFRAKTSSEGFLILEKILTAPLHFYDLSKIGAELGIAGISLVQVEIALGVLIVLFVVDLISETFDGATLIYKIPRFFRYAVYYMVVLSTLYLGVFDSGQFIYFQF